MKKKQECVTPLLKLCRITNKVCFTCMHYNKCIIQAVVIDWYFDMEENFTCCLRFINTISKPCQSQFAFLLIKDFTPIKDSSSASKRKARQKSMQGKTRQTFSVKIGFGCGCFVHLIYRRRRRVIVVVIVVPLR